MAEPVTLQINLSPADHLMAGSMLAHQLRFWRASVAEILVVVDENRPRGRFAEGWENGREAIWQLVHSFDGVRALPVDYSPPAATAVSGRFFGGRQIPRKDCRGGPYYSYFFGLHHATHDTVLHCDADMFFGGNGAAWLADALSILDSSPDIAFLSPLPGPPARDGHLRQLKARPASLCGQQGFEFPEMSTRVFLFNRQRFLRKTGALAPGWPGLRRAFLASIDGNPPYALPEETITSAMRRCGLRRFDFAGRAPGCWTLHPPYRCQDYFRKLPGLVERVERGDMPEEQLGDHDLNASLVDWSDAILAMRRQRWWHRLSRRLRQSPR